MGVLNVPNLCGSVPKENGDNEVRSTIKCFTILAIFGLIVVAIIVAGVAGLIYVIRIVSWEAVFFTASLATWLSLMLIRYKGRNRFNENS